MVVKVIIYLFTLFVAAVSIEFNATVKFHATVALDGTGDHNTIQDAINAAPSWSKTRYYINVKAGTYQGHVDVPADKTFLTLVGEGASVTIIQDSRSHDTGYSLYDTSTFDAWADGFVAKYITFRNTAYGQGQAVAAMFRGNNVALYQCSFEGFQDTLFAFRNTQFYKDCDISGNVDFIFGGARAVFQDCRIHVVPGPSTTPCITAQDKTGRDELSGFSFQKCSISYASGYALPQTPASYLGRPWGDLAIVVFMQSNIDNVLNPLGWLDWNGKPSNRLYYGEYQNYGPGADTSRRVNWNTYHRILDAGEAQRFTVANFIKGGTWLWETGVPYYAGL